MESDGEAAFRCNLLGRNLIILSLICKLESKTIRQRTEGTKHKAVKEHIITSYCNVEDKQSRVEDAAVSMFRVSAGNSLLTVSRTLLRFN